MEYDLTVKRDLLFTSAVVGDKVYMLLNKVIGPDSDINPMPHMDGGMFAEEMYYWKNQGKKICVKINSPGGRVTHGWSMIDAIRETEADTENIGMAYSMAGVCMLFGKRRKAYDYASAMLHAPRHGSPEYQDIVNAQFRTLLETRTKFSKAEIDDIMATGQDYKFNAQQMLAKGMIDEIIPTGRKVEYSANASIREMHEFFNKTIDQTTFNMENFIARLFGKSSEQDALDAVIAMKQQNESLLAEKAASDKKIVDLTAQLAALEAKHKHEGERALATTLIEGAIAEGKLSAEGKEKLIESATASYELVKDMLAKIPVAKPPQKTKAAVEVIQSASTGTDKTYEWLAKHDPDRLAYIAEHEPDLFNKLSDAYNAKEKA